MTFLTVIKSHFPGRGRCGVDANCANHFEIINGEILHMLNEILTHLAEKLCKTGLMYSSIRASLSAPIKTTSTRILCSSGSKKCIKTPASVHAEDFLKHVGFIWLTNLNYTPTSNKTEPCAPTDVKMLANNHCMKEKCVCV